MSRRRTRRRRGHVRTTIRDIVLLVVFCVVVWVAGHLVLLAVVAAAGAGVFWGARRLGRRRPRTFPGRPRVRQDPQRAPAATTVPIRAVSAGPDPAANARSLAQLNRHQRRQIDALQAKLEAEMDRADRAEESARQARGTRRPVGDTIPMDLTGLEPLADYGPAGGGSR
jgi:hypothetical protein